MLEEVLALALATSMILHVTGCICRPSPDGMGLSLVLIAPAGGSKVLPVSNRMAPRTGVLSSLGLACRGRSLRGGK